MSVICSNSNFKTRLNVLKPVGRYEYGYSLDMSKSHYYCSCYYCILLID